MVFSLLVSLQVGDYEGQGDGTKPEPLQLKVAFWWNCVLGFGGTLETVL